MLPFNKITLGDVGIADDGVEELCSIINSQNCKIVSVDLRGNRVSAYGLESLCITLKNVKGLESLSLSWNDLENDHTRGLQSLSSLVNNPESKLTYLDLRNANISHNSSNILEEIVKCPYIRKLDLSWNNLGDLSVEAICRGIDYRMTDLELDFKGSMITDRGVAKINESLNILHSKHPVHGTDEYSPLDPGPQDSVMHKRQILKGIYSGDIPPPIDEVRMKQMVNGTEQIILNPQTSELEILMSEMIKKKISAKDKILCELEEIISQSRSHAEEIERMKCDYAVCSNDNSKMKSEIEVIKSKYTKTKEHLRIEADSLKAQLSSIESQINRRDTVHRTLIDKIANEHRIQMRELSDDWEEKIRYLDQRIKGVMLDKDTMSKEVIRISERIRQRRETTDSELLELQQYIRQDANSRAEHTSHILSSRLIGITSGIEMLHRRTSTEVDSFRLSEQKIFSTMTALNSKKTTLEEETRALDAAISSVKSSNESLSSETLHLESIRARLSKDVEDLSLAISSRVRMYSEKSEQSTCTMVFNGEEETRNIREGAIRIEDLQGKIRCTLSEIEEFRQRRGMLVDRVRRGVSKEIYDLLGNEDAVDLINIRVRQVEESTVNKETNAEN